MTRFYRNSIDITSNEGIGVDAGSLWKLQNNELILIDDDQHVTSPLTEDFHKDENVEHLKIHTHLGPGLFIGTLEDFWRTISDGGLEPEPNTLITVCPVNKNIKYNPAVFHEVFDNGRRSIDEFYEA